MSAPDPFEPIDLKSMRDALESSFGGQGELVMPSDARPPILTAPVRGALSQWMYELNSIDDLAAVDLKPRQRCMLSGPPGCGKTTLAHHICARLGVPMLVVQSHEMISKYHGATGQNIGKLFKMARKSQYGLALFFDEFDAMANSREQLGGTGADNERAAITIALLQEFDRFDGLLFAATNVTGSIDAALWRRFDMQIEIGLPGPAERFAIVRMYIAPFEVPDETVTAIAQALSGASPALIRQACEAIKRSMVLGPKMSLSTDLPAIMARFAISASPADGATIPLLWSAPRDAAMALAKAPWPPVLP